MITKFKLFENPDALYNDKLEWNSPDAITFSYFNGELLTKKSNDNGKHSEIFKDYIEKNNIDIDKLKSKFIEDGNPTDDKGEIERFERRITKYAGRLWTEHKIISFWEYPPNYKVLHRIMEDVLSTYNIKFVPDEWSIEIISDVKEQQGREYYNSGHWENDPREVYFQEVPNYEGSVRRTDKEISSQHTLSPMLKTITPRKQKEIKGRKPGETTAKARYRLRKVYQESDKLKGKMFNVDYKIFHKSWDDKPLALITDFKIHKMEGSYIEVISKGYEYMNLTDYGWESEYKDRNKKGWVPFNDFKSKNVRKFPKKLVKDGTKRIKVFFSDDN